MATKPKKFSRASIGLRARRRAAATLVRKDVTGVALHWPGMKNKITTVKDAKAALRNWQDFHMDTNKWSDIAYNMAFDQQGNRYKLRGRTKMSAANGNTALNKKYVAILLLLAPGEKPSNAMTLAVRKEIRYHLKKRYKNLRSITGHGRIRPGGTECPGKEALAAIDRGDFTPKGF